MKRSDLSLYDSCQGCGVKCCIGPGPPIVFPREVKKIKKFVNEKGFGDFVKQVNGKEYFFIIRDKEKCPYLNKGNCNIEAVKPFDCRVYPMGANTEKDIGVSPACPVFRKLPKKFKEQASELIESLSPREKEWILEFGSLEGYFFVKIKDILGEENGS